MGEGIVGKRECRAIGADEGQLRMLGPGLCEHGPREVPADHRQPVFRQSERVVARAAGHIQYRRAGCSVEQRQQAFGDPEELRMTDPENPILSSLGSDPEDIARGLREFSKSAEMLSNDRPSLINEHPLQWVGVYRGKVSAKADDLPSLMEELERRGIPLGDTIVRFIEKNQRTLIL